MKKTDYTVMLDTSMWVALLRRKGDESAKRHSVDLVNRGKASWCDVIRLELWRGVSSDTDRLQLSHLETIVPTVPIDEPVWERSRKLADKARKMGFQFPLPDLIIYSCAIRHGMKLEARDKHYERMESIAREVK